MASLRCSTWGDPTATKHVLLIHGIASSSQMWHRTAQEFVSRGCFVTAPNLLGHGDARRSTDYTIAAFAEELRPLFTTSGHNDHRYDVVVGYSLGSTVACALLPLLKSTRPVQVVLVHPYLELTPASLAYYRRMFSDIVRNPKTPEGLLQEYPQLTREDAVAGSWSVRACDVATVEAIFDQNVPWSFSHQLSTVPDNVKVTVLEADPCRGTHTQTEDLMAYPRVTAKITRGVSYMIPFEAPFVIVETALGSTEVQG